MPPLEVVSYFGQQPEEVSLDSFLSAFYPDMDETLCLRTFKAKNAPEGDTKPGSWDSSRTDLATSETRQQLSELNKRNGIYFLVNAGGHEDKDITRFNAFFVESDEGSLEEQHERLNTAPLETSIRVETKKSIHAYWLLEGDCTEADWRKVQKRLIAYFNADPQNKNPARVMRLPFFNHVTYNGVNDYSYKLVEVAQFAPSRRYTVEQMLSSFPAVVEEEKPSLSEVLRESVRSGDTLADWRGLNEETKRRLLAMRPLTKNSDGEWAHVKGICHDGKGDTGIFINLRSGAYGCHKGCETAAIRRALGLPERPLNSSDSHIHNGRSRREAFPKLNEKALYGLAGDFVGTVYPHTEASRAALLVQLLVGFGNVVGRNPYYVADGAKHHTNLYAVIVGKTSAAKGSALGHVKNQFKAIDEEWAKTRIQSGLSSGEGLITAVDDARGMGDKRLLVVESEFASVLHMHRREGNILSAVMRNLWDSGNAATLTKISPVSTTDAHVSIIGHITPEELERCLGSTELANGYANRFLFACVERSKNLPDGGKPPLEEMNRLTQRFVDAVRNAQTVGEMSRDVAARELWHSVYGKLVGDKAGAFGKVVARARAQVLRLSFIYALLDCSSVVRREHLEAALALWQYCEDSAHFIFSREVLSKDAQKLLGWIREARAVGLNKTEMFRKFGGKIRRDRLDLLLDEMKDARLAVPVEYPTAGRTEERWFAVAEESRIYESDEESQSGKELNSSYSSNSTLRAA